MECLNLGPFCYENQAQDIPKTPQDARGGPKRRPRRPDRLQEPPRPPPDLDFGPFWQRFDQEFGLLFIDF